MSLSRILQWGALALAILPALASACDPRRDVARESAATTSGALHAEPAVHGGDGAAAPVRTPEHGTGAPIPGTAPKARVPAGEHGAPIHGDPAQARMPAGEHGAPLPGTAASAAGLERARGGMAGMSGAATLDGMVSGNSASNVVTGANSIQASSFAGASGIPIVIQNTGANVLIQNATVINLQFK